MIIIVDYKMGNLGSIVNMLLKIGGKSLITSDISEIDSAEKIILPGVGNFNRAIKNLHELNLVEVLNKKALHDRIPILGICLGMQLFAEKSEEGILKGLGWINAEVKKFSFDDISQTLKIPHMGWNNIKIKKDSPLFKNAGPEPRYYFVHSYHFCCRNPEDVLASTYFGYEFTSAVQNCNIMGVQFHPEKSHKFGMQVLRNFLENY